MDIDNRSSEQGQSPDNTLLIRAMVVCRDDYNSRNRESVYHELLRSTLLVPVARALTATEPGEVTEAGESGDANFLMTRNPETGEPVILAFTDQETLAVYTPAGTAFIDLPAASLFAQLSDPRAPSLIVCARDAHLPVSRPEILRLANGQIPPPQLEAVPTKLSTPAPIEFRALDTHLPQVVYQQLKMALTPHTEVAAVYVFLAREEGREPESAVGVVFSPTPDEQTARPLMDTIVRMLQPYLPADVPLVAFPLAADDEFARHLSEAILACYQRRP
ncbi:MAG: SseB family protein [Armatimonadota bacterium]